MQNISLLTILAIRSFHLSQFRFFVKFFTLFELSAEIFFLYSFILPRTLFHQRLVIGESSEILRRIFRTLLIKNTEVVYSHG